MRSPSVNLSSRQLFDRRLIDTVRSAISGHGLHAHQLTLEITESVLMEDIDAVGAALHALEALGLKLAIDDFGTGFSSLSYLKQFPVHMLKVDQSFVAGLGQDDGDSAIVRAVIELAHSLGLTAVAEGVETAQQLAALRSVHPQSSSFLSFARRAGTNWNASISVFNVRLTITLAPLFSSTFSRSEGRNAAAVALMK